MKNLLLIEENPIFAKKLKDTIINTGKYEVDLKLNPASAEFKSRFRERLSNDSYSCFIINARLNEEVSSRTQFNGIELFKQIRFKEGPNQRKPVIILGYPDLLEIIRLYPAYSILLSEGCCYLRQPFEINILLNELASLKMLSSLDSLKKFYRDADRKRLIEREIKHDLGNIFSPFQLLRGAYISNELLEKRYNKIWNEMVKKTIDLQKENPLIEEYDFLMRYSVQNNAIRKNKQRKKKSELTSLVKGKKILLIDDEHDKGWSFLLKELFYQEKEFKIDHHCIYVEENDRRIFECIKQIGTDADPDDFSFIEKHIGIEKKDINKKNDAIEEYNNKTIDYDLILLDLSLRKEKNDVQVYKRAGYKLLQKIRKTDPSVPVLIFSATEKAKNLSALEEWGITGLFSKEIPQSTDEYAKEYYQTFKSFLKKINERSYLRDVWHNIMILKEYFSSSGYVYDKPLGLLLNQSFYLLATKQETKLIEVLNSKAYNEVVASMHSCMESELRVRYETKAIEDKNEEKSKDITITCNQLINQMPEGRKKSVAKKINIVRNDLPTIHGHNPADIGTALFVFYGACLVVLDNDKSACQLRSKKLKEEIKNKNPKLFDEFLKRPQYAKHSGTSQK